jgi:hypothetical protein
MPRDVAYELPQPLFDEPVFTRGRPTPDPRRFAVPHPSDTRLYDRIQALLYEDVVGFAPSRGAPSDIYALASALGPHGPEEMKEVVRAGHITFQMVGDIGASTNTTYPGEIRVSDRVTDDCHTSPATDRPRFLYLMGDIVYDFGEPQYYYDQFYDPYRNYPAPIFAIPGNHDSFIVPGTPDGLDPLVTFRRNFCSLAPVVTPEAGPLHRTAMTEPGVYFTLDAPYVRIIGLFSNALEDPGVISSESGKWAHVPDYQLEFLRAQLARIQRERYAGAVLLTMHHPPFNYAPSASGTGAGGIHGGSPAMLAQIDQICAAEKVYPHVILSGHAHNYQRYTRSIRFGSASIQVPFIVCGGGGHGIDPLVQAHLGSPAHEPSNGADVTYLDESPAVDAQKLILDRHDDRTYGYLRVTADPRELRIRFVPVGSQVGPGTPIDDVTIDLANHTVIPSRAKSTRRHAPARRSGPPRGRAGRRRP